MIPPFVVPTDPNARLKVVEANRPTNLIKTAPPLNQFPKCPSFLENIYQEFPPRESIRSSPFLNRTDPASFDCRIHDGPTTRSDPRTGYHCPCCPASNSSCQRNSQTQREHAATQDDRGRRHSQNGTTPLMYFVNQGNPVYKLGGALERVDISKLPGVAGRVPTFTSPSFTVQRETVHGPKHERREDAVQSFQSVVKERSIQPDDTRPALPLPKPVQETTYYVDPRTHGTLGKSTTSYSGGNVNTVYSQRLDLPEDVVAISPDYVRPEFYSAEQDILDSPDFTARGGVRLGSKNHTVCC